jgi:hypothetical protein
VEIFYDFTFPFFKEKKQVYADSMNNSLFSNRYMRKTWNEAWDLLNNEMTFCFEYNVFNLNYNETGIQSNSSNVLWRYI